jgi:hypothetical protein
MFKRLRQMFCGSGGSDAQRELERIQVELGRRRLEMLEVLAGVVGDRRSSRKERGQAEEGSMGEYDKDEDQDDGQDEDDHEDDDSEEVLALPDSVIEMLRKSAMLNGVDFEGAPVARVGRHDGKPLTDEDRVKVLAELEAELKAKLAREQDVVSSMRAGAVKGAIYAMSRELWLMQMRDYLSELNGDRIIPIDESVVYEDEYGVDYDGAGCAMDMDRVQAMARNAIRASKSFFQMVDEMEVRVSDAE